MATINTDANTVHCVSPKKELLVERTKSTNEIVNAAKEKDIQNKTASRRKSDTMRQYTYDFFLSTPIQPLLLFSRKCCCYSMLSLSSKPVCLLTTTATLIMVIGILVICLKSPTLPGMPNLYYTIANLK